MADILLSFGVATSDADVSEIQKGLEKIITKIEKNPPKVRVGLTVDDDAIKHFKKQLEAVLNTVGLANGTPITLNISGLGEISAQATEAANAMKRAAGATKQHGSALTPVLNSYREMHALMRKNQNATDATTESYKGVRAQADFFKDALELARRESVSIEVAFARMGVSIDTALKNATDSMAKLKAEMEHTGQSGTVTAKQVYDTVAKMREAVSKNKNASGLDSYQLVSGQLGNWEAAAELIRKGGATVEQALSLIGDSSESASAKVASITTALASLNEEMKRTGASGTTTKTQIENTLTQARTLISGNENAKGLTSFVELNRLLIKISPVLATVKADGSDLFDKLSSSGIDAKTVVQELQAAMSKFKNEMSSTGQSGTVTAKQVYDTVAKMRTLISNTAGKENFSSFKKLEELFHSLQRAEKLVREESYSASDALNAVGMYGTDSINKAKEAMASFKAETAGAKVKVYDYATQLKQVDVAIDSVQKNLTNWSKARKGSSSSAYAELVRQLEKLVNLRDRLNQRGTGFKEFESEFARVSIAVRKANGEIKAAGENTRTWADKVHVLAQKFGIWLSVSQVIMTIIRNLKKMVRTVIELDTAMTELKKITNETDATYGRFLTKAAARAKALGATLSDVINATADFARLGYGIDEASKIADAAIIYKNVGDGIEDITQASESIISTMQAFGIEASHVMTIVDKFNEVGNNFAISSTGIGEALLNSASALHAAGNTLDESIALITAANEVIQSPEKVGTAMKTLSMYIRAAKVEAEEAGIATDGMASSVSELRDQVLGLTNNRVDIMESDTDFKSTYQIVKELASVWKTLEETEQAALTELVGGGVRNANVVSALMSNFAKAEQVLETSAHSAGSALKENEVYLQSIEGKISQFKASWQELSDTIINSTFIKVIVMVGTAIVNATTAVSKFVGGFGLLSGVIPTLIAIENKFKTFSNILNSIMNSTIVGGAK